MAQHNPQKDCKVAQFLALISLRKKRIKLQSFKNFPPDFFDYTSEIPTVQSDKKCSKLILNHIQKRNPGPERQGKIIYPQIANKTPSFQQNPFSSFCTRHQIHQEDESQYSQRNSEYFSKQLPPVRRGCETERSFEEGRINNDKENLLRFDHLQTGLRVYPESTKRKNERRNISLNNEFRSRKETFSVHEPPHKIKTAFRLLEEDFGVLQRTQSDHHSENSLNSSIQNSLSTKNSSLNHGRGLLSHKIKSDSSQSHRELRPLQSFLTDTTTLNKPTSRENVGLSRNNRLHSQLLRKDKSLFKGHSQRNPPDNNQNNEFQNSHNALYKKELESVHLELCNNFSEIIKLPELKKSQSTIDTVIQEQGTSQINFAPQFSRERTPNFLQERKTLINKVSEQKKQMFHGDQLSVILSPKKGFEFSFSEKFPFNKEIPIKDKGIGDKNKLNFKGTTELQEKSDHKGVVDLSKTKKNGPLTKRKVVVRKKESEL